MKILQIRPVNYDQVEVVGRTKHNSTISKEVLIINSMLNPQTDSPKTLINILENFDVEIDINLQFVSQVMKRNTIEWYSEKKYKSKTIFLIVGDCATCTYKASQDIYELNERRINAFLVTFSEMENLIIKKLYSKYKNKVLFMDNQFFEDSIQQQFEI
jgi:hypothetical protein